MSSKEFEAFTKKGGYINWLKKNMIPVIITLVVGLIITLGTTLMAQQDKKIDTKADEGEVIQMIKGLEAIRVIKEQQYEKEDKQQQVTNTEQRQINKGLNESINELNIQLILLRKEIEKQ